MLIFCKRQFQMDLNEKRAVHFNSNFTSFCSKESNCHLKGMFWVLAWRWPDGKPLLKPVVATSLNRCIIRHYIPLNLSHTKSPKLKCFPPRLASCLCPVYWSQVVSQEWRCSWRCSWSSADRRCSNYIWIINNFIAWGAPYIRCLTVYTR